MGVNLRISPLKTNNLTLTQPVSVTFYNLDKDTGMNKFIVVNRCLGLSKIPTYDVIDLTPVPVQLMMNFTSRL